MNNHRNVKIFILLGIFIIVLITIGQMLAKVISQNSTMYPEIEPQLLALPDGKYFGVAWTSGNTLIYSYRPNNTIKWGFDLWQLSIATDEQKRVELSDDINCKSRRYEMPQYIADNRIGYLLRCIPNNDFREFDHLIVYDVANKKSIKSLSILPIDPKNGMYSWQPDLERVLITEGSASGETSTIELKILNSSQGPQHIKTDSIYNLSAAYSPDGNEVAFFSVDESNVLQMFRAITGVAANVYDLYLMQPDGTNKTRVLEDLENPSSLAWSPDGSWLMFSTIYKKKLDEEGLWIVNLNTGQLHLLAEGNFERPAWSPDNKRIAALQITGDVYDFQSRIVILDIERIVK